MEELVLDRMKRIIKEEGLSVAAFAKKIGFNQSNLSKVLRGERNVPENLIGAILDNTHISREWLMYGRGQMNSIDVIPLVQSELTEYTTNKNGLNFQQREDGMILMTVPVVPFRALGSPDDEFAQLIREDDVETMQFLVDGVHHGNYIAFRVEGDSMDDGRRDSFARGDMVLVRELSRDKWLPKLHIGKWPYWVINWDNNVRIKEIVSQDDLGNITLHSLNPSPEYCDFTINLQDVRRLFNVVQKVPKPTKYGI